MAEHRLSELIAAQTGRMPREPWRAVSRCSFGHPMVISSPSRLADGSPFPTWTWLTCPYLVHAVSALESRGDAARWRSAAADDEELARDLRELDRAVRAARAEEGGGIDDCAGVGLAGQEDPLGVKCLHAHVSYALAGLDDPIGAAVLAEVGRECADDRCAALPMADASRAAGAPTPPAEHDGGGTGE